MKLLFPFFITASSLSLYRVPIKNSATKGLEIMLSANDHGVGELTVTKNKTKMVKNVFKWPVNAHGPITCQVACLISHI